jgi:hypothetical protein
MRIGTNSTNHAPRTEHLPQFAHEPVAPVDPELRREFGQFQQPR